MSEINLHPPRSYIFIKTIMILLSLPFMDGLDSVHLKQNGDMDCAEVFVWPLMEN